MPKIEERGPRIIAYVIARLACGGAEMVLLELIGGLDRRRFRPVVISLAPPAELSDAFAGVGAEMHHLGLRRSAGFPLAFARALALFHRIGPDLAHGVLFYGDLTARLLAMFGAVPRVVSAVHSPYIGPIWTDYAMRVTDRWADAVTAVSALVAKARIEARTASEDKITVIPNGVDAKRFARPEASALELLRQRFRFSAEDRVLLCVGRLEPEKNHVLLLRVFARLRGRFPQLKLLLAGSGRLESDLRALAGELGVRDQVVFAGQVAPVGPLFHLAEWFVLASSLEGLPMVVLEAMAARLPMVVTRVGGIPEVIEDGRTGWLVPPNDEAAFESALVHALQLPPGERARVAEAAHCEVERRFSVRGMVEATEALYERLLGEPTDHRSNSLGPPSSRTAIPSR